MAKISQVLVNNSLEKKFVIEDVNSAFVNEIRRIAINQISVLAIEDVYFTNNSSAMYDEVLAHRLGLLPLKTTKDYVLPEKCKCKSKGCAQCRVKLKLDVKGPKRIYGSDFKSTDPNVKPVNPEALILEITKDQEVALEAHAILNNAKEHAKWNTCLAFYHRYPKISIKNQTNIEIAKVCPKKVFEVKNNKLNIKNLLDCNLCNACQDKAKGDINIDAEKNKFIFTLESWGQYSPKDILIESSKVLSEKIKNAKLN